MATLADAESDAVAIELTLDSWAGGDNITAMLALEKTEAKYHKENELEAGINSTISIKIGEEKLSKRGFSVSTEEVLDLLLHIDRFLGKRGSEDEFEWSTADPSVQMLKAMREGNIAHVDLFLKVYGEPEGYMGNAGLEFRFDTSLDNIIAFGGQLRDELLRLLKRDNQLFERLEHQLESKIEVIRGTGRSPYKVSNA
ncbi:MAG TPA: hypothetical protein VFF30_02045 [Nitrososphaerales archaeon]|nr:hypothetical protein [Nitrososphaerales archaeon]